MLFGYETLKSHTTAPGRKRCRLMRLTEKDNKMSERELNKCKKCHSRHNGNGDICGICQDNTIDLLTLGLLQEKNKVAALNKKAVAQAAYIRELEIYAPKLCICCEEITEENAHLHRNCGK